MAPIPPPLLSFKHPSPLQDDHPSQRNQHTLHLRRPTSLPTPKVSVAPKKPEDNRECIKAYVFQPHKTTIVPKKAVDDREYINAHDVQYKNPGKIARENRSRHPKQETPGDDIL
ncbi:hypothetical protein BGX33_012439 [Mortierella sp. NVP41]|nr:hypothetical protein BGX33_012439 [Mortierella sp. NVP41]